MKVLTIICALLSGPLSAETPAEAAFAASARLQDARAFLQAAEGRSDRVTALTETVQAYEAGLAALRDGLRRAAIRKRTLETDLATRSNEIARLLGVLQTIGRTPAPILFLHPSGPTGTARSGMMLAAVTPALQDKVSALREQIEEVAVISNLQTDALTTLRNGLAGVQTARSALSAAISNRTGLPQRFLEDPVQMAVLLASAQTLSSFAAGLAQTQAVGEPYANIVKGTVSLPVVGRVIRQFKEADAAGVTRPGILIATRPRALVSTPLSATIRYAGPLLDYGTVVILEPSAGILWVIAGLDETFGKVGQVVPDGTPIGLMGGIITDAQAILNESAQGYTRQRTQTLYLEVRDMQDAVNPADWFAF